MPNKNFLKRSKKSSLITGHAVYPPKYTLDDRHRQNKAKVVIMYLYFNVYFWTWPFFSGSKAFAYFSICKSYFTDHGLLLKAGRMWTIA